MATFEDPNNRQNPSTGPRPHQHQRAKSSVLRSFIGHKRTNSDGATLRPAALLPTASLDPFTDRFLPIGSSRGEDRQAAAAVAANMGAPDLLPASRALGELQRNRQDQFARSAKVDKEREHKGPQQSPQKSGFSTISLKAKLTKPKDGSPIKPKKSKSATNLGGLLRVKSIKNLKQLISEEEGSHKAKDKENRTPPGSVGEVAAAPPPIFAQFTSQSPVAQSPHPSTSHLDLRDSFGRRAGDVQHTGTSVSSQEEMAAKPRPRSYHPHTSSQDPKTQHIVGKSAGDSGMGSAEHSHKRTWGKGGSVAKQSSSRPTILNGFPGFGPRTKSQSSDVSTPESIMDPKEIDKHLEAMLDRRNIPENQRYKMRNLNNTIKMEFIRQDWAETQFKEQVQAGTNESDTSMDDGARGRTGNDRDTKKKDRPKSFTLAKSSSREKGLNSPTKKSRGEGTLGRHFRSKSSESVTSERPSSSGSIGPTSSSSGGGLFSKVKAQQGPGDFVAYLRKVQKPELVEVGKLHKLRLLLRNETVSWTEDFIRQGGMKEIVELLHRILEIEWREEHEDALLHEDLLCLKALCTTALALQYLHSIRETLFPAMLHMIFDPEKKGPSEFTTRSIVTSVLFTYIEVASPQERLTRTKDVLRYLRDPEAKEEDRPVSFVLEMRRDRPYRVWNKEVVGVTKEVFWIFLHHLNIVALPSDKKATAVDKDGNPVHEPSADAQPAGHLGALAHDQDVQFGYMMRHFPQPRPPVPAAPYVGGVEWDATNYLASHLDLVNAIIACTGPTATERNALRRDLRISGWERILGGSFRLCKEKFYGAVHDGLRAWVAAAADDGWDVRDVRYGPPPESRSASPAKRGAAAAGKKKKDGAPDEAPRIEMPKLDFAMDNFAKGSGARPNEPWLS